MVIIINDFSVMWKTLNSDKKKIQEFCLENSWKQTRYVEPSNALRTTLFL